MTPIKKSRGFPGKGGDTKSQSTFFFSVLPSLLPPPRHKDYLRMCDIYRHFLLFLGGGGERGWAWKLSLFLPLFPESIPDASALLPPLPFLLLPPFPTLLSNIVHTVRGGCYLHSGGEGCAGGGGTTATASPLSSSVRAKLSK